MIPRGTLAKLTFPSEFAAITLACTTGPGTQPRGGDAVALIGDDLITCSRIAAADRSGAWPG